MKHLKRAACSVLSALLLMNVSACGDGAGNRPVPSEAPGTVKSEGKSEYIAHLEEKYADYQEVPYGLDITKKTDLVGICYSTWFTKIHTYTPAGDEPPNISEALSGARPWGGHTAFHYWAKPALGYYSSDDKEVIRTHMTQLYEMGADYIIIDNTNASIDWKKNSDWNLFITRPCRALLNTIVEMREEGLKTPYVVFWSAADTKKGWSVAEETYDQFISKEKWKDCFVYWEGKPFMLITGSPTGKPSCEITVRRQWGLDPMPAAGVWSFLNIKNVPTLDADGFVEQTCVCAAVQETYMTEPTAHGRNHGIFMYEQWKNAFDYRPKAITITWWNEWCAQLFYDGNGNPRFVDNYTQEFSRDIEPMEGGHGDMYYQWTKQYIAAYKNMEECPRLVEEGY